MKVVTPVRKEGQDDDKTDAEQNRCDSWNSSHRPVSPFAYEKSEPGVSDRGSNQTRLESEPGEKDETGEERDRKQRQSC